MTKESMMSARILPFFKELEEKYDMHVGEKVKAISDFSFIRKDNSYKIQVSFTELDIALYKKIKFNKTSQEILSIFELYRDSATDTDFVIVPFIIIELKRGNEQREGVSSDSIRARNEAARKYYFIAEYTSKAPEVVYKRQDSFDEFFLFYNNASDEEIKEIIDRFIFPDLDNLLWKNIL